MVADPVGEGMGEGACLSPAPVKKGQEKDGHQRRLYRFHVFDPPQLSYSDAGSDSVLYHFTAGRMMRLFSLHAQS